MNILCLFKSIIHCFVPEVKVVQLFKIYFVIQYIIKLVCNLTDQSIEI